MKRLLLILALALIAPAISITAHPRPPTGIITQNEVTVYVTKTGAKYHTGSCSYLRKSKIAMSLSDAKAAGYTACSRCGPPR